MEDSKTLFLRSKFSWARENVSSQCIENLALCPPKDSPALSYINLFVPADWMQRVHARSSPGLASNEILRTNTCEHFVKLFKNINVILSIPITTLCSVAELLPSIIID